MKRTFYGMARSNFAMRLTKTLLRCVLLLFITAFLLGNAQAGDKPNIMLIIADDLTIGDIGCYGGTNIPTPNIDRIAREGLKFERMFSPASVCSPTRHALYTGLFPVRSGAYPNHTMVEPTTKSVVQHLGSLGYRVGLNTKSHCYPPLVFSWEKLGPSSHRLAKVREFITRDKDKPWCAIIASHEPHSPWTMGKDKRPAPDKIVVPPYLIDTPETRQKLSNYYGEVADLDEQVGACLKLLEETEQAQNTILVFLSEQGGSLPFAGKWTCYDNGVRAGCLMRWPGKIKAGTTTSALAQYVDLLPTFIAAAGADPITFDTGCPDANGKRGFDGLNALDVITGKTDKLRDYVFAQHTTVGVIGYKQPYPTRMVRDTRYKLIRNLAPQNTFDIGAFRGFAETLGWNRVAPNNPQIAARVALVNKRPAEELFDLQNDPYELKNLAQDPNLASVKARLSAQLDAWMQQQGDKGMATELEALKRQPKNAAED